ncbi:MAG: MCE family protein [Cyanobacteria bacterium REEB459]|nr:MCE family protein [Cyanobacteria bacterium REEB459]
MRERAIREGSVGLLILLGIGLFAGLVLWLKGLTLGRQSYRVNFLFDNTLGMQEGTMVRFRGVRVGRVLAIQPGANQVTVVVEITQPDLKIPSDSAIQVNQAALIGETTLEITPVRSLSDQELALSPFKPNCQSQRIICDGDQLKGEVGANFKTLVRSTQTLVKTLASPEIITPLKATLGNTSQLTANAKLLTQELTVISRRLEGNLDPLFTSASRAVNKVGDAATQFELTGSAVNQLISLNRGNLIDILDHLNQSSADLRTIMATLSPAIQNSQLLRNLDTLSANASAAMADIRALTSRANTPENLVTLQQTLDSARNVFQSAHKVLSDVDELTGDPQLREKVRRLINGLSSLVSMGQQLEVQSQLAQTLTLPHAAPIARITLTPATAPAQGRSPVSAPATASSVLMTYNGQPYHIRVHSR